MVHLRVLGGAVLLTEEGQVTGRAAQRHRLALLAFLAASPRQSATRDRLIAHLWPESETARARHRLRGALGEDCLVTAGDTVGLNPERAGSEHDVLSAHCEEGVPVTIEACLGPRLIDAFHGGPCGRG